RHRAHAEVEGRLRLFGRRVRVPARDGDLSEQQAPDERFGSRELGRESDEPDGPRVEKPLEQLDVGIATRRRGMNPETAGREEGALQVNPEDPTAVDECGFDSELHSPSAGRRASRMLPEVVASRSCASSASTPARIETIATFALPPAAARASSTRSLEAPVAVWTIRRTRAR